MGLNPRLTITLTLLVLVAAALANGFYLPLAGRRVRPEHIAAPVACAAFVLSQLVRREKIWRLDAFSALAVAWVIVNGISSWLYAPQPRESLVHVVRHAFLVATFLTVANLPPLRAEYWGTRVRWWLALGLVALGYGLVSWVLAQYFDVWLPGTFFDPILSGISISGTQLERNLFGILAATLLAVAFYSAVSGRLRPASGGSLAAACAVAGAAVVVSLTRSAWIAVAAAGPVAYVIFDRRPLARADRALLQAIVGLPALLAVLIGTLWLLPAPAPSATAPRRSALASGSEIAGRLSTFGELGSDFTVNTRIQDARWAVNDWLESPILGRGTGSFGQIHGIRVGTEAWISNLVLHTMVDTGLVGLSIQMSLFLLVAWRAWQAALVTREPVLEIGLKATTLGLLVALVAYQLTDGTWLAVFWVHLGLIVNGIYCVRDEQRLRSSLGTVLRPGAPAGSVR